MKKTTNLLEVVFDFDTTGSVAACLMRAKRQAKQAIRELFDRNPHCRIGVIAHGDYCDEGSTYVVKKFPLSQDVNGICEFIDGLIATGGGDEPECYEYSLYNARSMGWTAGSIKALVELGDEEPHPANYWMNKLQFDWRNEAKLLGEMGVKIYAVQLLGKTHATYFYRELAKLTGGQHLSLDQFDNVTNLLMAVCYKQAGNDQLADWETVVSERGQMNPGMSRLFDSLLERKPRAAYPRERTDGLVPVPSARFQLLTVEPLPNGDRPKIRDFVEANGLIFQKGRGFYEFLKRETVQEKKDVVLVDRVTGEMFTGPTARNLIGLPYGMRGNVGPADNPRFRIFIQSTSVNRKLAGDFLYEVDLSR